MLSILDHQRNRLKNMLYARIDGNFENDSPASSVELLEKKMLEQILHIAMGNALKKFIK